jgi:ATP-dependent Clp protease ATP-binding subunit ClpA
MVKIVDKFIGELEVLLRQKKVRLNLTPTGQQCLAELGFDPAFGARPLARVIEDQIKRPLTDEILFGRLERGGVVTIDAVGETLSLSYEEN